MGYYEHRPHIFCYDHRDCVLTDFDCSFCPFSKYKGRFNIFKKIDKTPVLKNLGAFFFPLQWFVVVRSRDLVPIHFHFEWKMLQFSNELHFLRKSFFGGKLMMFVLGTRGVIWYLGIWRKEVKVQQISLPRASPVSKLILEVDYII